MQRVKQLWSTCGLSRCQIKTLKCFGTKLNKQTTDSKRLRIFFPIWSSAHFRPLVSSPKGKGYHMLFLRRKAKQPHLFSTAAHAASQNSIKSAIYPLLHTDAHDRPVPESLSLSSVATCQWSERTSQFGYLALLGITGIQTHNLPVIKHAFLLHHSRA